MVNDHGRLLEREMNMPAVATRNTAHDSYTSDTNFDASMVIILVALLCGLICALGLNSIVRCALRCSRRLALETPEQAAARLAATGLKKRQLRQIPVAAYGADANISATDCAICLGEFMDGEKVRILPKCNHGFHVSCIDTWLLSHSSCPNCRHSLLQQSARPSGCPSAGERQSGNESGERGSVIVLVEQAA